MLRYVLELLDGEDRVDRSVELSCIDDGEALLRAAALAHPHAVMVRQELRRVGDVRDGIIVPRVPVLD